MFFFFFLFFFERRSSFIFARRKIACIEKSSFGRQTVKNLCTFCLVSVKQDTKIFKVTLTIL